MLSNDAHRPYTAAIVSCDIAGHSATRKHQDQLDRIIGINEIVSAAIASGEEDCVVWASGGDGGHVAFRQHEWRRPALDLIIRLQRWAREAEVPLKITAHHGTVTDFRGADGRIQIVGGGINLAGWMLSRASPEGVVVSRAFCDAMPKRVRAEYEISFHDSRLLQDKSLRVQELVLMSIAPDRSFWAKPLEEDRNRLDEALERNRCWDVMYFAKRILQVSAADEQALDALWKLDSIHLKDSKGLSNPLFHHMDDRLLSKIVKAGQLVERHYGEVICKRGDKGNAMFVILRGQVGVYGSEDENPADPICVHREGEIVGELAFTLARNSRTADLVALSDTALLSFSYEEVAKALGEEPSGKEALERIDRFIKQRVLEHVSQKTTYLFGHERNGPLAEGDHKSDVNGKNGNRNRTDTWRRTLFRLEDYCRLISVDEDRLDVEYAQLERSEPGISSGLYILVAGKLRHGGIHDPEGLSGETFPLLWVSLRGGIVLPCYRYEVDIRPAKILYLASEGLSRLEPPKQRALHAALRRAAAGCFYYDAFIAYDSLDESIARRWAEALEARGLRVYLDDPTPRGTRFLPRLEAAILNSRAVVPVISRHVTTRNVEHSWVKKEIDFHCDYFEDNSRIFPIQLPDGESEKIAPGFPYIVAGTDENADIDELATRLARLRDGDDDVPYSLNVDAFSLHRKKGIL